MYGMIKCNIAYIMEFFEMLVFVFYKLQRRRKNKKGSRVSELHLKFLIDIVLVCGPKMLPK
jgi:uncharacterized membrane protein YsdA (DUF1294 family)